MSKTLLLADDSLTIQRVVDLTFAQEDVRVVSFGTGDLAVKWMEGELPDIVLADVGMPQPDGYAVAHHMKQSARLRDVPVLLLTGAFEPLDDDKARESECDGVLVKPFEPQHLVARVVELLGRLPKDRPEPAPQTSAEIEDAPPLPPVPVSLHLVETPAAAPAPEPEPEPEPEPLDLDAFSSDLDALDTALEFVDPIQPPAGIIAIAADDVPGGDSALDSHESLQALESLAPFESLDPLEPLAPLTPLTLLATEPWDLAAPSDLAPVEPTSDIPPVVPSLVPPVAAQAAMPAPAPPMPPVSLASAFAALLAAEQAHPADARPAGPSPVMTEAAIEDVVRRVLLRVTDDMVRQVVLDAAERLVKAEIEKIRDSADE